LLRIRGWSSLDPAGGRAPSRSRGSVPRPPIEKKETMPDLAYLALTVVGFIVLGLLVKAVEKL
jgi:hypothetical protein